MVSIQSTGGRTDESIQDVVGNGFGDGLEYDDANGEFTSTGRLYLSEGFAPGFGG